MLPLLIYTMELEKYLLISPAGTKHDGYPELKYSYAEGKVNAEPTEFFTVEDREEWVPNEKEIIYLFPYSNVDRKKLKAYCENNDFKLTTKPEKATIAFMDPVKFKDSKGSNSSIVIDRIRTISLGSFQDWASENLAEGSILNLEKGIADKVLVDPKIFNFDYYDQATRSYIDKYKELKKLCGSTQYSRRGVGMPICYYHANSTLREMNAPILEEENLLAVLNKGLTLTEQSFMNVCKMLESNDSETTRMAYQVMADVDYKSSAIYLLLIFTKYDLKIANSNWSCKTNFKGLLKYLGITRDELYYKLTTEATIRCMKRLGLYNQTNVLKLSSLQDIDFKTRMAKDLADPLDVSSGFVSDSDYLDIDCD
jgi:hypothetical protein